MSRVCRAAGIGSRVERPFTSNEKPAELLPFAAAAALAWYSCSTRRHMLSQSYDMGAFVSMGPKLH